MTAEEDYGDILGGYIVLLAEKCGNGVITQDEFDRLSDKLYEWDEMAKRRGLAK